MVEKKLCDAGGVLEKNVEITITKYRIGHSGKIERDVGCPYLREAENRTGTAKCEIELQKGVDASKVCSYHYMTTSPKTRID